MADSQSNNLPASLQGAPDTTAEILLPVDLSWFYVLRQLSRRQLVAAHTFARHVARMELAIQPLILAKKRGRFAVRKARRRAEREAARRKSS